MASLYSGSADEWSYVSNDVALSPLKTVDFVIDNFEIEIKKGSHQLKSRLFTVKHTHWHIEVDPARKDEKTFLHNDNDVDMVVDCKIIIGELVCNIANQVFKATEACKKVLSDGKLKVNVEMKLIQEEETVILGEKFNLTTETSIVESKIYNTMSFPDFKVICNGKVLPFHKAFLATGSSVFKNMLEANMKEAIDGSVEILNHTEIVVEHFVKFFYTNHVKDDVLNEHAVNFVDLGEQYQMEGLKKMAEQAMIANLSTENMLRYYTAGDMYQGEKIKEAAKAFIRKNRRSLVEQEGWRNAVTDKDLLLDLIEALSKD